MFLTRDKAMYTSPCIRIPTGSEETLSSVSPCDLWIVRAHASLIGNFFRIFTRPVFVDVDTSFDIRKIGFQSLLVFELYR